MPSFINIWSVTLHSGYLATQMIFVVASLETLLPPKVLVSVQLKTSVN